MTYSRLIYLSDIDVTIGNGPGINEREFCHTLRTREDNANILILNRFSPGKLHNDRRFSNKLLSWLYGEIIACKMLISSNITKDDLIISRLYVFPLALLLFIRTRKCGLHLRHCSPGINTYQTSSAFSLRAVLLAMDRRIKQKLVSYAGSIDVPTIEQKATWEDRGLEPSKVRVKANCVNCDKFSLANRPPQPPQDNIATVGYVGGSPTRRGLTVLMEIARKTGENIRFIVVGDDPDLAAMRQRVAAEFGPDRFEFTGQVDYDLVPQIMARLDFGVAFDDQERLKLDGNSNQKIRQYLASGAFAITNKAAEKELEDSGFALRVDIDEPDAMVAFIKDKSSIPHQELIEIRQNMYEYCVNNISCDKLNNDLINFIWK